MKTIACMLTSIFLSYGQAAIADEFKNLRCNERHRFGLIQAHATREPFLRQCAGLVQGQLVHLLRR